MKLMSPHPILIFDNLLPREALSETSSTCATLIQTQSSGSGEPIPVLLMDRNQQAHSAAVGDLAGITAALECDPAQVFLPAALGDPHRIVPLVRILRQLRPDLPIQIATPDGEIPQPLRDVQHCTALSPEAILPIPITDFGDLTRGMLLNGLVFSDDPELFLRRPNRVVLGPSDPLATALSAIQGYLRLCEALWPETIPTRALQVHLEGSTLFDDRSRLTAWVNHLLRTPLVWSHTTLREATQAQGLLHALLAMVDYSLGRLGLPAILLRAQGPTDPAVKAFFGAHASHTVTPDSLAVLHQTWSSGSTFPPLPEALLRQSDDAARLRVFATLQRDRTDSPHTHPIRMDNATQVLGSPEKWVRGYRNVLQQGHPRVVVIPTWQCELRCRYCTIVKQDGRVMLKGTLERAIDLLLSSDGPVVELHFFGGEPFLEWPLLEHACRWGQERAHRQGRTIRFLFTTNAYALSPHHLDVLSDFDVHFQLSLDGDANTQNTMRRPLDPSGDSYEASPARSLSWFKDRGISHDLIQVVHPTNAHRMAHNFTHLLDLGAQRIQLNYAIGAHWDREALTAYADGLEAVGHILRTRWAENPQIELINLTESLKRVRTNLHVTVDWDGTIFGGNAFLYLGRERQRFTLGHLDDRRAHHIYVADGLADQTLFDGWYWKGSVENNQQVGAVLLSFVRHMRSLYPDRYSSSTGSS